MKSWLAIIIILLYAKKVDSAHVDTKYYLF